MNRVKKILSGVVLVLVVIQFFPPKKNNSGLGLATVFIQSEDLKRLFIRNSANHISTAFKTSKEVQNILAYSCNDCHSNTTVYPWYCNVQPVGFWLAHHVNEGKEELNFDEFTNYSPRRQYHKLEETEEMLNENEMPLSSYTFIHRDAVLSAEQKQMLIDWTKNVRKEMEATYPMDSLVRQRK